MKSYHVKITTRKSDCYVTDIEAEDEKSARKILKERWGKSHKEKIYDVYFKEMKTEYIMNFEIHQINF